jgi:hypothetical protein
VKTEKPDRTEGTADDESRPPEEPAPAFRAATLWFGVIGGVVAWALHILVAWSFLEVGCLAPGPHSILQQGPSPRGVTAVVAYVATGLPWLVTALALLVCLRLRARMRSVAEEAPRAERTHLMIVIGLFLNVMALAAITGSAVGILVLRPCT